MALEQFKTQVLLLHSQQSTLDALGARFNVSDKYSVHFATSGSEALHTLGETPIHVLVSAQDLPGMSGLEALREARKRSPEMIGILLAGSDRDDGLEALVGDKEVFQIVRGAVTPDALLNIIDTATRRVRILTLAESANDTAANVDEAAPESSGEHIIMETGENGASLISDGTGRMPALRPEKIQVAPQSGSREVDVLVLTKDDDFLQTIRASSRGLHNVHHASTAGQAQEIVRKHKVGVLVTDAAVAGSKVQVLTQALRRDVPRLVAVVAGRRDDGEVLMGLINEGQVYRFLMKPVSPGRARLAIEASIKHHLDAPDTAFAGHAPKGNAPAAARRTAAAAPAAASARPALHQAAPNRPSPAPAATAAGKTATRPAPQAVPRDALGASGRRRTPVITPTRGEPPAPAAGAPAGMGFGDGTLGGYASSRVPWFGAAAAVLLVLAGGIWLFAGDSDETPADGATPAVTTAPTAAAAARTPAITESDVPLQAAPGSAQSGAAAAAAAEPAYAALLDDARFAVEEGRIIQPAGNNAVDYYVAARKIAAGNEVIDGEIVTLGERVFAMAETALLEQRAADADAALEKAALLDAGNPRLAFLSAQLEQMQLRAAMDGARLAIREARFEDARRLLRQAQTFAGADPAEIGLLRGDLTAARSAQQVDDVLARAGARLAEDKLTAPANDNARYYYELALSNDPDNLAAQQGLDVIAGKLVLRARDAIDNAQLEEAAALLGEARALDADNSDLAAASAALDSATEQRAAAAREAAAARAAAARQAEAERVAARKRRSAETATLSTGDAVPDGNAVRGDEDDSAAAAPAARATADTGTADTAGQTAGAGAVAAADGGLAAAPAETAAADAAPDAERDADRMVAVSDLVRVNYVAPEYPRNAQRRNITGWVDVAFTVTESGSVADIEVLDSTPGSVFDDAATSAVREWRFEPTVVDGMPLARRTAIRMTFSLQ